MCWASGNGISPSLVSRGMAARGRAWRGEAWLGEIRVTDGGMEGFGLPCHPHKGWKRLGTARRGVAGRGVAGPGPARAADGSTGGFGSHCCSLWRAGVAGYGLARHRWLRRGWVMQGSAWPGKG